MGDSASQVKLSAALAGALGPAGLLTEPADLARYLSDFRGLYHGKTRFVARPDSVEAVAAVLRIASAHGIAVVPHGGNTSYCGGATPDESGRELVLSLERLAHIRAVDAAGFSITVDAGCTLAAVQAAAAQAQRLFPLSLGSEGSCQIGGNLSTNAGGTAVLRYGMVRDLVLGLEVVLADGRRLDQLRGLRKDNTGYDVKQLFLGAEGTLGVITGACLKLYALPADYATALVALPDLAAAVALLGRLRASFGELLSAFEYVPGEAYALVREQLPAFVPPYAEAHAAYALVELGLPAAARALSENFARALSDELEAGRIDDALVAGSLAQREAFWYLREHIPEAQRRLGASLKHDVSLPVGELPAFVAAAGLRLGALAPMGRLVAYGHVGDGNLHFNLSPRRVDDGPALLALEAPVKRLVHDLVAAHGGSFSAEHGIGRLKVGELERYEDPVALELMRGVKAALDPKGIMNPGKVLARP
jgi:FAD/FMN-containing dehydrogenase